MHPKLGPLTLQSAYGIAYKLWPCNQWIDRNLCSVWSPTPICLGDSTFPATQQVELSEAVYLLAGVILTAPFSSSHVGSVSWILALQHWWLLKLVLDHAFSQLSAKVMYGALRCICTWRLINMYAWWICMLKILSCILNVHLGQLPCLHIQGSFSRWIHVGCDFPLLKCFLQIYRSPASPPWMQWTPLPWWQCKCSRGLLSLHCWKHKSDPGLCCGLRGNS